MTRYFLFLLLFLSACAPRPQDGEQILAEARALRRQALETGRTVEPQIEALTQRSNSIQIQGRALTEAEIQFVDKANNLISRFESWRESPPDLPARPQSSDLTKHQNYLATIQTIRKETEALLAN